MSIGLFVLIVFLVALCGLPLLFMAAVVDKELNRPRGRCGSVE